MALGRQGGSHLPGATTPSDRLDVVTGWANQDYSWLWETSVFAAPAENTVPLGGAFLSAVLKSVCDDKLTPYE